MPIDTKRARALLKQLDLKRLFVEELNWANPQRAAMSVQHNGQRYNLTPQAEAGGMVLFTVDKCPGDGLPDRNTRLAIHKQLLDRAQEHILVFINEPRTTTLWMWVDREGGKRKAVYEHRYHVEQPGDSLLQKLQTVAFEWEELDEEGKTSIVRVLDKVRASLAIEKVTKRFYKDFEKQHDAFLEFIKGIEAIRDREWYASIMLNRLMFIYFVQKKGFLGGDSDYLGTRLVDCQTRGIPYYAGFLKTLFFQGFACKFEERTDEERALLGDVPYLNGGLFLKHQIEEANGGLDIPDKAFESIFAFFDRYQWHLDDRPLRSDNEINPDVLGYIFEKYINNKQMGAYYTKEDITEYITKNTVLPFLFDKLGHLRQDFVVPLPIGDIEPYIHDAAKKGVDLDLPDNLAAGLDDVAQRGDWNRHAGDDYALPTETWREHVARRRRYQQILDDFDAGKITTINDFITYNLDLIKFAQDFIGDTQDPLVVNAFYFNCLKTVTVLDPTCGSGAFLFAALSILEPLYELCLERMDEFLARKQRKPQWAQPFEQELRRLADHPSRRYFIYKSIIVSNLYGVDIMEEAVEICKLRLFLKLVAQVEDVAQIEPLPDIDFNIRAGNTLVGYASFAEIEQAKTGKFDFGGVLDRVKGVDRSITTFRRLQTESGISAQHFREAKENLLRDLRTLEAELNNDLAFEYGVTKEKALPKFVESHKPFHWYIEFYDIMAHGGFDIIVGNPPYVEVPKNDIGYKVRGFKTERCPDIYAMVVERAIGLLSASARLGMIVPISIVCADKFAPLQSVIASHSAWLSNYSNRPAQLFEGAQKRLTVAVLAPSTEGQPEVYTTEFKRWFREEREALLPTLLYGRQQGLPQVFECSIGKVGAPEALSVVAKAFASEQRLGGGTVDDSPHRVYYVRTPGYFCQFWARPPVVREKGKRKTRPRGELYWDAYPDELMQMAVTAALNSSLFYYYVFAYSDCRHMNRRDVVEFPFDATQFDKPTLKTLAKLGRELLADYDKNISWMNKSGLEIESFNAAASKPIIDEIDRVLAEHYGFTDEELDFILNYDIKYRLGADEGEE